MSNWSTEECSHCRGAGVVLSDRISKAVRCSCMAGRQLAESETAAAIIQVTALLKRKKELRR